MDEQKRGKNVAIAGAVLELAFTAVMIVAWRVTGSFSALAGGLFLAAGIGVWLTVAVLFYCRQLAETEAVELEEIAAGGPVRATIFERGEGEELRPAALRLRRFERWGVPVFTIIFAALQAIIGVLLFRSLSGRSPVALPGAAESSLFVLIILFLGFLFSRYSTGMGQERLWRPLRPTGSYLLVAVLLMLGVMVALLCAWQGYIEVDVVVGYVIIVVQVVLAVEMALSFLLDLYRPRMPGQEHRLSFDSRLFGLLAEPQRVGHSIADALNYQFGFEVSRTWFYKLLSRAFIPLIIFGVVLLFGMSSIVIVQQGERQVVFRWGKLRQNDALLTPGLHLKLPWPIETTSRFDVGKIHEIQLGTGRLRTKQQRRSEFVNGHEVFLWTQEHGPRVEKNFLVAVQPREGRGVRTVGSKKPPPPVRIIKLVAVVRYKIGDSLEDIEKYGFKYRDPEKLLTSVAYREMTRYCASATLTRVIGESKADRPEALMTTGRERAALKLKERIEKAVGPKGLDMGVKITFVGFTSVHPPKEAAPAYEKVLAEERHQDVQRYQAEADANKMLVRVAGDPIKALQLALAIRTVEELETLSQLQAKKDKLATQLDDYLRAAKHDIVIMDKQIRREKLLGMILPGGRPTGRMILRENYASHLNALEKLQQSLRTNPDLDLAGAIAAARQRADDRFHETTGEAVAMEAEATGEAIGTEMAERGLVESFQRELPAYKACPKLYMLDRTLDVWDEVLPGLMKYVLLADRNKIQIRLNWEHRVSNEELIQPSQGKTK